MDDSVYITIEQLPKENIYKHMQMVLYVEDLLRIVIINSNVDNIQILGLKFCHDLLNLSYCVIKVIYIYIYSFLQKACQLFNLFNLLLTSKKYSNLARDSNSIDTGDCSLLCRK